MTDPRPWTAGLRRFTAITGKDLREQLRSRTLPLFGVVLPLGLAVLFSTIMGGDSTRVEATYGVVDRDGGALATAFTDEMLAEVTAGSEFSVTPVDDYDEAVTRTEGDELDATFVLPEGFTADAEAGRAPTITVVGDADASLAVQIARQLAESYATEVRAVGVATAVAAQARPGADPQELAERAAALPQPVTIDADPSVPVRELDQTTYTTAGMAVFFLFFTAMLSVSGLHTERTQGTMARLLAAPVRRTTVLLGKLASTVLTALAAMAVIVAVSTLVFGAEWGPTAGVALLTVAVTLASVGLLALITSVTRTTEAATNVMSMLAVLFGLFGGAFVPVAQLGPLATVSYLTPHRWYLQGLTDLTSGDPTAALAPAGVLLALAAVTFGLTLARIGKVVRP